MKDMGIRHGISALFVLIAASAGAAPAPTPSPVPSPIPSSTVRARVYEADSEQKAPLFLYARVEREMADGSHRTEAIFKDPQGGVVYSETSLTRDGKVVEYTWNHHQLNQTGFVRVRSGKAEYSVTTGGKTASDSGDAPDNLVVGPTMLEYLRIHWRDLLSGKDVPVRIGVPDRMGDYGFKFVKLLEATEPSGPVVHVQLKATSPFVSLVVDPIAFVFTKDGSRVLRMRGLSLLKVKKGDEWKDLVAETVFE